jgi:hypothetical protein
MRAGTRTTIAIRTHIHHETEPAAVTLLSRRLLWIIPDDGAGNSCAANNHSLVFIGVHRRLSAANSALNSAGYMRALVAGDVEKLSHLTGLRSEDMEGTSRMRVTAQIKRLGRP